MTRLIALPAAEKRLLSAVGAVPAGVRISIPQLRDHLVSQRDVLDALQALIDKGKLDRATLRPPTKAAAPGQRGFAIGDGEPSKPLFDALKAEGARRGLSVQALSLAVWGNKARIYQLLAATTVRRSTADKIRAWIASRPPAIEPITSSGGASAVAGEGEPARTLPRAPAPRVSGHQLAVELTAYVELHDLALSRVSQHLFGGSNAISRLRRLDRSAQPKTVDKVRAFVAGPPPLELLRPTGRVWRTAAVRAVKGVRGLPSIEVHECGGSAPPVLTAPAGPKLTFEEQLARVERGEVGITANIKIGRPDPSGTLGGVTGEINL